MCELNTYQVDDTFTKVGYDPAANAQATKKVPPTGDVEQDGSNAGGGGLPRMDLSTLLEKVQTKHCSMVLKRCMEYGVVSY